MDLRYWLARGVGLKALAARYDHSRCRRCGMAIGATGLDVVARHRQPGWFGLLFDDRHFAAFCGLVCLTAWTTENACVAREEGVQEAARRYMEDGDIR